MTDADILRLATHENRVVLTADKDFGELVYRQKIPAVGVILLRFRAPTYSSRIGPPSSRRFQDTSWWPPIAACGERRCRAEGICEE